MKDEPQKLSVDPPSWDFHLRYLLRWSYGASGKLRRDLPSL